MKKITFTLFTAAAALLFGACSDFLESDSPSTFIPETVFSSTNLADKAIIGIYSTFGHDRTYAQTLSISNFNGSDTELQKFSIGAPTDGGTARPMGNYLDNSGTSYNEEIWSRLYTAIEYANQAISGIETSPLYAAEGTADQKTMKALRAEAKVLRAWCYMELARNFGNIPFKTEPSQPDGSNFYLGKTDMMEIYAWLVNDLGGITEDLPWKPSCGTFERVGRGFAKGLRARIALYRGGYYFTPEMTWKRLDDWQDYYQIAKDECQGIMADGTHNLNPSFQDIFYQQCQLKQDPYGESLFEFGMALGKSSEIGHLTGVPYSQASNSPYGFTGGGNSVQTITPVSFLYSFKEGDQRRDVSVAYYNYNNKSVMTVKTNPLDFTIAKWSAKWFDAGYKALKEAAGSNKVTTGINFVAMRYSDVLLMFAEAENALNGPTADAKNALYEVRNRAYGGKLSEGAFETYLSEKGDFQLAVEDERMWEFAGEGIRKYDLIRWNKLGQKLLEMKNNIYTIVAEKKNPFDNNAPLPSFLMYKYQSGNASELDLSASTFYDLHETMDGDKLVADPPAGYTSTDWLKKADNLDQYLNEVVSGLVEGRTTILNNGRPWRPIHGSVIADSHNMLKNDYGFN